ncbi:hypothetical protein PISL3812_01164 [Talaromyces islandicus]|uniref:Uncharacterized protein n=1 Tax=Talaromyces islandicus TaxID=28573 RepID=A0A0U1LLD1_TALIS|nr:hypothetical protein PISL3812_01164 [Talaromyces islandicus]
MSADLDELAYNLSTSESSPGWPTAADLQHGSLERREKAWQHVLMGKKIVSVIEKGMEETQVAESILPENHRFIGVGLMELMDYDEDRLTIDVDENKVVRKVSFR